MQNFAVMMIYSEEAHKILRNHLLSFDATKKFQKKGWFRKLNVDFSQNSFIAQTAHSAQNNRKGTRFISVFIVHGIYNFDKVSHSLLNTSSYICRHLPVSAIVYTNVHYQNDNKKHWPNFLLWIANIIFFSSGLFVKYSAMNYYVKIFFFTQFGDNFHLFVYFLSSYSVIIVTFVNKKYTLQWKFSKYFVLGT